MKKKLNTYTNIDTSLHMPVSDMTNTENANVEAKTKKVNTEISTLDTESYISDNETTTNTVDVKSERETPSDAHIDDGDGTDSSDSSGGVCGISFKFELTGNDNMHRCQTFGCIAPTSEDSKFCHSHRCIVNSCPRRRTVFTR